MPVCLQVGGQSASHIQLFVAMDACARIRGVPLKARASVRKEVSLWGILFILIIFVYSSVNPGMSLKGYFNPCSALFTADLNMHCDVYKYTRIFHWIAFTLDIKLYIYFCIASIFNRSH